MVEAACHRCGREWDYTGQSDRYGTCPNCKTSVRLEREADPHPAGSGSERAEPSPTAERGPDPSDRDEDAVAVLEGKVSELYELQEQQGERLGEMMQEGEEREEAAEERGERLDDLRDGLEEVAALFREFVEANGGEFEYEHIETGAAVPEALREMDAEDALGEVEG